MSDDIQTFHVGDASSNLAGDASTYETSTETLTPISPQQSQSPTKPHAATSVPAQSVPDDDGRRKRFPSDSRKRVRGPRPAAWSNREAEDGAWRAEVRRALKRDVGGGGWDCLRGRFRAERTCLNRARSRCFTPTNQDYADYGARGIRVHKTWLGPKGFLRFLLHIGPKPTARHTLDRINNAHGYEPGNVRWALWDLQANNRRSSRFVRWGDEVMTCAELGRYFELPRQTVVRLANEGWFALTPANDQAKESA